MELHIFKDPSGCIAVALYEGNYTVLYDLLDDETVSSYRKIAEAGLRSKALLSMETGEFSDRYEYKYTISISDRRGR